MNISSMKVGTNVSKFLTFSLKSINLYLLNHTSNNHRCWMRNEAQQDYSNTRQYIQIILLYYLNKITISNKKHVEIHMRYLCLHFWIWLIHSLWIVVMIKNCHWKPVGNFVYREKLMPSDVAVSYWDCYCTTNWCTVGSSC